MKSQISPNVYDRYTASAGDSFRHFPLGTAFGMCPLTPGEMGKPLECLVSFLRCSPRGVQTETEGARDARAIWQQHLVTAQHLTGAYFGYR